MKTNLICLFVFLGCFFDQTLADEHLQPLCDGVAEDCPNFGDHVNTTANCSVCMPGDYDAVCAYTEDFEDTCDENQELFCSIGEEITGTCSYTELFVDEDSKYGSNEDSNPGSDGKVNVNINVNIEN